MIYVPVAINMHETSHIHSMSGVKPQNCLCLDVAKYNNLDTAMEKVHNPVWTE